MRENEQPIEIEQFPGLVTNPGSEEIGPEVSEHLLNVVAIDHGEGRVRAGLAELNTANWNVPTGGTLTIRAQNPPANSVDALIFCVQNASASNANEGVGLFAYTTSARGGLPFTGGAGELS